MLKKSTVILSSCNTWQGICGPVPTSTTSCRPHTVTSSKTSVTRPQRGYAMVADGHSRHHHEDLQWPEVKSVSGIPTPHQIFNQKKGSRYSKRRFYDLVKLYHPDRHGSTELGISDATKLERYRLVVAANEILSDPVKRAAYERFGAGWNGMPDVTPHPDASQDRYSKQSCYANATWEDWEKWYEQDSDSKAKQSPLYFSNSAFLSLVVIFATLGGVGQATRANSMSLSFLEQQDALHDRMSKELRRRKEDSVTGNREARIRSFLQQRDPLGYGIVDPVEESYRKIFSDPEVCSSEDIKERRMDIYRQKNQNIEQRKSDENDRK